MFICKSNRNWIFVREKKLSSTTKYPAMYNNMIIEFEARIIWANFANFDVQLFLYKISLFIEKIMRIF